jgi:hypothetical protein
MVDQVAHSMLQHVGLQAELGLSVQAVGLKGVAQPLPAGHRQCVRPVQGCNESVGGWYLLWGTERWQHELRYSAACCVQHVVSHWVQLMSDNGHN